MGTSFKSLGRLNRLADVIQGISAGIRMRNPQVTDKACEALAVEIFKSERGEYLTTWDEKEQ